MTSRVEAAVGPRAPLAGTPDDLAVVARMVPCSACGRDGLCGVCRLFAASIAHEIRIRQGLRGVC